MRHARVVAPCVVLWAVTRDTPTRWAAPARHAPGGPGGGSSTPCGTRGPGACWHAHSVVVPGAVGGRGVVQHLTIVVPARCATLWPTHDVTHHAMWHMCSLPTHRHATPPQALLYRTCVPSSRGKDHAVPGEWVGWGVPDVHPWAGCAPWQRVASTTAAHTCARVPPAGEALRPRPLSPHAMVYLCPHTTRRRVAGCAGVPPSVLCVSSPQPPSPQ